MRIIVSGKSEDRLIDRTNRIFHAINDWRAIGVGAEIIALRIVELPIIR